MQNPFGAFERAYYTGGPRPRTELDAATLEYLRGRLRERAYPVLSLDVFDTLLIRDDRCERRRFFEIAERWAQAVSREHPGVAALDLYLARIRAAEICYSCGPIVYATQEGRLDHIVEVALSLAGLPKTLRPRFESIELDYEFECLVANPVVVALVQEHARAGGRVMLLSDMYLAGQQIHGLTRRFGLGEVAGHIFSSADSSVNKRSGTIFAPAARALGVEPNQILHIGDNFHSDFSMPRLCGWEAQHLPIPLIEERRREADAAAFAAMIAGADS